MKSISLSLLFLASNLVFSQGKELQLQEIDVQELLLLKKEKRQFSYNRHEIINRSPEDLADILKTIPGISLKNYGGLGGLKTISSRGISGSHSGILIDGFMLQNAQTGQIDLSTIQLDNIQNISFSVPKIEDQIDVVSAYFNANNLKLNSYLNQFSSDTFQLRMNLKQGSFGQIDSYLSGKYNRKKCYFSFFTKYRVAKGNYPFTVLNQDEIIRLKRINNQFSEFYAGINVGINVGQNAKLNLQLKSNFSDKSLPGAIILYNQDANQFLMNKNSGLNLDFIKHFSNKNNSKLRVYLSANYDELIYLDSSYLNSVGFLKSNYWNTNLIFGSTFKFNLSKKFELVSGIEENYSFLRANSNFNSEIQRFHLKYLNELKLNSKIFSYRLNFGLQQLDNQEVKLNNSESKFYFTPSFTAFSNKNVLFLGELFYGIKRNLRVPTFNELYYNQIGNTNLKPEIANQIFLGTYYDFRLKNNEFSTNISTFYNLVENKIVAVPTKNLFIWSIQNVGIARIIGAEIQIKHKIKLTENLCLTTDFNYSFQKVQDFSSRNSATFKHQLAYSPLHILNLNFLAKYKRSGLNLSAYYNSKRYALNQNIKSNEVPSFYTIDFSLFYDHKIKKSEFRYSISIKNCLNNSYSFIQNYIMPGRNYLLSISYAFN